MKKVYRIKTAFGSTLVVAESFGDAQDIFNSHHWPIDIREIEILPESLLLEKKVKE